MELMRVTLHPRDKCFLFQVDNLLVKESITDCHVPSFFGSTPIGHPKYLNGKFPFCNFKTPLDRAGIDLPH